VPGGQPCGVGGRSIWQEDSLMNEPRRPVLPPQAPPAAAPQPDPRLRPDERKEGGPDFGKEGRQKAAPAQLRRDAREGPPGVDPA
jgi:hypothetical protein